MGFFWKPDKNDYVIHLEYTKIAKKKFKREMKGCSKGDKNVF